MNIYLFELDSVRNSEKEVAMGQAALFREIAVNGNTVVLTYNQLSDSAAFWAALKDEVTYNAVMELCRLGMIQVSLFAGQRTAAQYILGHIRECTRRLNALRDGGSTGQQQFYFSLIPLDADDGNMLEDLYHAIQYSDVQLLKEKAQENIEQAERYTFLYRYAELILMLSRSDTANHRQKHGDLKTMLDYLEQVERSFPPRETAGIDAVIARAAAALRRVSAGMSREELQRRSVWYKLLDAEPFSEEIGAAEAVIDLCYNYTLEESISGVEKRYTDGDAESFLAQFRVDMDAYWSSAVRGAHVFHRLDEARKNAQTDFAGSAALPDWSMALELVRRNVDYARKHGESSAPDVRGKDPAERLAYQKQQWSRLTKRSLRYRLLLAGMYAIAFVIISYLLNGLQELLTGSLETGIGIVGKLLLDFLSIAVFGIASSVLFTRFGLPDILETVESIIHGVRENRMLAEFEREYTEKGGLDDAIS